MRTLHFVGRTSVPHIDGAETLEPLVRASAIHDELPDIGIEDRRWSELVERAGDRPIWMLNFLSFRTTATYPAREADVPGGSATSGERAYARYGQGLVRPLTRVGGHIAWALIKMESDSKSEGNVNKIKMVNGEMNDQR
jgi:hypothetical protein